MNHKATVNPLLTQLAQEFVKDQSGYVGTVIAPVFNSGLQSGEYYKWDRENYLNLPTDLARAPGTAYQTLTRELSDDAFVTKDLGIQVPSMTRSVPSTPTPSRQIRQLRSVPPSPL